MTKKIIAICISIFFCACSAKAQKIDSMYRATSTLQNATTDAEFPGGFDSLVAFLTKEINYPKLEKKMKIEGVTLISFEVNKYGKLFNVVVASGKNRNFNKEALRVTHNMPDWVPATKNGKKVKSCFSLPFQFKL
jgi:TonB family protein